MTKALWIALVSFCLVTSSAFAEDVRNPLTEGETWTDLKEDIVGEAEILDGSRIFTLEAPYRAHDAATVPITMRQAADSDQKIVRLTLIIDENPAPVAAEFEFGEAMGPLSLETRVRVNAYSNVRALAQTEDGKIYMTGRFVKASGGCAAPATKDAEAALAALGKMKLRQFEQTSAPSSGMREAQVMVRHPNYSGLQMDQLTQLYIPAEFVHSLEVLQDGALLFRMSGGISISEDPSFRFTYLDRGADALEVKASDTEGRVFERSFELDGGTS